MEIGERALKLILDFEGWDVPWKWPGSSSGITIPYGYDLGYEPFQADWMTHLPATDFGLLNSVVGLRGLDAQRVAPKLKGIKVPKIAAAKVFSTVTLPRYVAQTRRVFPGSDKWQPDAFGALVSLVFNRGPLVDNTDRRREMLAIHKLFVAGTATPENVAPLVASMARLWPDNKASDGDLHDRRLAEAQLIRA